MEVLTEQDPQRLLADLAAEYERSRRFLEQLESSFARDSTPTTPSGLPYSPAGNDDRHEELPVSAALDDPAEAPSHAAAGTVPQPESVPSKLRAKLRSLFTRSVSVAARNQISESGSMATVGRTASDSQSAVSAHTVQRTSTYAERPATAVSASPPPRRASQVYYATSPAEAPRAPRTTRSDADAGRPATGRRTSVVYFGGDTMDSSAQGWLARVAGAEPPAERPATGRRTSIDMPPGMDAAGGAAAACGRVTRTSVDFTVAGAGGGGGGGGGAVERPLTARRASIVQFGDTVAVPGGGLGNGGGSSGQWLGGGAADADFGSSPRTGDGGPPSTTARRGPSVHFAPAATAAASGVGGALQDTTNPHEFMSAMAGPRRATSFQQRSGTALLPTSAQRLRSATTTVRRTSIEAYVGREPPQQQGSSRVSIEGRQAPLGPSAPDHISSAMGRRAGSMEMPRPFSASRQHPAAAAAATTAAPAVNIHSSALFSPAAASTSASISLAGSTASVVALAAAAAGATASAAAGRPERPPSPQATVGRGIGGPQQLRLQHPHPQPHGGVAWAPPPVAAAAGPTSPTCSPGAVSPTSPGDAAAAQLAGRGRVGVGGPGSAVCSGVPALRGSLSVSSKRLLDRVDVNGTPAAAAAAAMAQDGIAPVRERIASGTGMMEAAAAAATTAAPVTVSMSAVLEVAAGSQDTPSSPASGTSPTGGLKLVPPGSAPYSRVPQPPPPLQPPQPSSPPAQPQTLSPLSPQPHPPALPSPTHQPRPPSQPNPQTPQALSIFRLRGFGGSVTADGAFLGGGGGAGDSGGKVPRANSPLGFAVRMDEHAGSAVRYERSAQPAM